MVEDILAVLYTVDQLKEIKAETLLKALIVDGLHPVEAGFLLVEMIDHLRLLNEPTPGTIVMAPNGVTALKIHAESREKHKDCAAGACKHSPVMN